MKTAKEFLAGAMYAGRGLAMWIRSPGLLALGIIPAVITIAIFVGATILYWSQLDSLIGFLTGFSNGWSEEVREAIKVAVAVILVGISLVMWVLLFTAMTLVIGDPFYQKISERVEDLCGGVPDAVSESWVRSMGRAVGDSIRLVGKAVLLGIVLFPLSFIPVVGQTVVPVLGALIGGWFLAMELTAMTFDRRGIYLKERRRILAGRRAFSVGFGTLIFLFFLIPLGAVVITPAAVAGATQLARELLGENPRPLVPLGMSKP